MRKFCLLVPLVFKAYSAKKMSFNISHKIIFLIDIAIVTQ